MARIGDGSVKQIDCDGNPITLYAYVTLNGNEINEGVTYSWTGPNDYKSTERSITITEGGDYTLSATHTSSGITSTATQSVSQMPKPEGSAGPDKVLTRDTPTATLEGSVVNNSGEPIWLASDGGNFVSGYRTLNPVVDAPGTYTLILRNGRGCTTEYTVKVTREEEFYVRITNNLPQFNCDREPLTLYSTSTLNGNEVEEGIAYSWTGPDGYKSDVQNTTVTVAGTYTLEATHIATGLTSTTSIEVGQYTVPEGSAGPNKRLTCNNPTVTLEGSVINNSGSPRWHAGYEGGNIVSGHETLNPVVDAPGTYYLVLNSGRCTTLYSVVVTRDEELIVSATGGQLDCTTGTIQLTGSSSAEGATYSWMGPNDYESTEQNPVVKVAGTYTLTAADPAGGCSASTSVVVTPSSTQVEITQHTIDFNIKPRGLISSIDTEAGPVTITGRKRLPDGTYASENYAAIFDSQDPTGDDTNLYTVDWGQVLIINQYQDNYPDATQWGGELILDFSEIGPVTMESFKVVGMDNFEDLSWVYLYDGDGKELNKVYLKPLGMNSKQLVHLGNTRGVMKMKVVLDGRDGSNDLAGSAAIDDIKFHKETVNSSPCKTEVSNITHAMAYPTSFSDNAKIEFIVRETENYTINLYDTQGMLIKQLQSGSARAGELTRVELSGRELKEGMYLARLVSDSGSQTFKLILKR
ncbi:MAG: T9SS type A sorting domain-containing protein [Hymenobacteraceae bacterium]|nr:T9SS type A sorting domain-containing protein [Hymenobacteraceae bacterium]